MAQAAVNNIDGSDHQGDDSSGGKESIWNAKTMERIQDYVGTVEEVKTAREALTAKLAAGKTAFIDEGFNKEAMEAILKYATLPEEKKENFDITYAFWRRAIGDELQDDLFVAAMQQQVKVTKAQKKSDSDE